MNVLTNFNTHSLFATSDDLVAEKNNVETREAEGRRKVEEEG